MNAKVVILVLVLVALVAIMALGAGVVRDSGGSEPPSGYDDPDVGVELLGALTGGFMARFDLDRLSGCDRSGRTLTIGSECLLTIVPGSARPSEFRIGGPSGSVLVCFGVTREGLRTCLDGEDDQEAEPLDEPATFTVANDTAFVHFDCRAPAGDCTVRIR